MGDQAVGFQQMTDQRLLYLLLAADRMLQIVGSKLVVVDTDILIVQYRCRGARGNVGRQAVASSSSDDEASR